VHRWPAWTQPRVLRVGAIASLAGIGCGSGDDPQPAAAADDAARVACAPLQGADESVEVVDPFDLGIGRDDDVHYLIDETDEGYEVFVGDDELLVSLPVTGQGESAVGGVDFVVLTVDDGSADGFTLGHDVRDHRRRMAVAAGVWAPRRYEELLSVGESLIVLHTDVVADVPTVRRVGATVTHLADLGDGELAVVVRPEGAAVDALRLFTGPTDALVERPVVHVLHAGDATSIDFTQPDGSLATLTFEVDDEGPVGAALYRDGSQLDVAWLDPDQLDDEAVFRCLQAADTD